MHRALLSVLAVAAIATLVWYALADRSAIAPRLDDPAADPAPASVVTPAAAPIPSPRTEAITERSVTPSLPPPDAPPTTVVVHVETFDGAPLAEADVFVIREAGEERQRQTDAGGNVVVSLQPADVTADVFRVRARYRDLLPGQLVETRLSSLAEPIILVRMQPTGEIELALRPAPGVDPATLEATPAYIWPIVDGRPRGAQGMRIDSDRVAHSGPLPLGQRYRVSIDTPPMQRDVDGPTAAGEVVRVAFELGEDRILLTGRILGPDGRPRRSAVLRITAENGGGVEGVNCDRDGNFVYVVDNVPQGEAIDVSFENGGHGRPVESASVHVPALAIGRNEVGTLQLAPTPPIATGRVVDDAGMPVANAMVMLVTRIEPTRPGGAPGWFNTLRGTSSKADGTFVLDGPAPPGHLGVGAIRNQGPGSGLTLIQEGVVEFDAPATDLTVVLQSPRRGRR